MRGGVHVAVLLLAAACAGPPPDPNIGMSPPRATPASAAVSPADQAIRELRQEDAARGPALNPPRATGEPVANPYDIGAEGQTPAMPSQASPVFRGL
jgi:hypothetical protein